MQPKNILFRLVRSLLVSVVALLRITLSIVVIAFLLIMHTMVILIPVPSLRRGMCRAVDLFGHRLLLFIFGFAPPPHQDNHIDIFRFMFVTRSLQLLAITH